MSIPYTFSTATGDVPLSELDANFATPITLGTSQVVLGGTLSTAAGLNITGNAATATTAATATNATNATYATTAGTATSAIVADSATTATTAGNVTGVVTVSHGGTNATTASAALTSLGASPLAGSTSITTLGTVTTGVWNGTAIPVANGGTGSTTAANALTALGAQPLFTTQTANTVYSGPSTGSPATPTFRALVAADIPTLNQNSTGSSGSIANTGGWAVTPSGTKLYFSYNGVNVGSLDSSGNFIAKANITAYGTP